MGKAKLFITGMGGMTGRCLAQYAFQENYLVAGTINNTFPLELKKYTDKGLIKHYQVDLTDLTKTKKSLQDSQPDVVVHLAGKVLGRADKKTQDPKVFTENITIIKNILSAVKSLSKQPKFILVSGCLVYNRLTSGIPIAEISVSDLPKIDTGKQPFRASKIEQERILVKEKDLDYIIVRPTQLTGPGKIPGVIEYYIAKEIAEIQNGNKTKIQLKNKLGEVDLLDVRDAVIAYLTLIKKGVCGEIYHLSSGSPVTVENLAKSFLEVAKLDPSQFKIESKEEEQVVYFRFSSEKLKKLGWKPHFSVKEALTCYYQYFQDQQKTND
jgi:GDP-4-dehydro-6-deoxy-D-mannose reductase